MFFFFTLQGPTDGDVEAVDAEGGTPTLPETLLLGVGFHCSGRRPAALTAAFECLSSRVEKTTTTTTKKKKKEADLGLSFLSAERRWRSVCCHFLIQTRS